MQSLLSIEKAVQELSPTEFAKFRHWFTEYDAVIWDAQIEKDAEKGKFDNLAEEALAEFQTGKVQEL